MRQFVRSQVSQELKKIELALEADFNKQTLLARRFQTEFLQALTLSKRIAQQAYAGRLQFIFSGFGPEVVLEGTYEEIARIVTRDKPTPETLKQSLPCNSIFSEAFTTAVHLCGKAVTTQPPAIEAQQAALWSSSYQGTTVVEGQFDRILKGRAEFKTNAADVSQKPQNRPISFLILELEAYLNVLGGPMRMATAACFVLAGLALSVSVISAGAAGGAYLAGAVVNAAADHRYRSNSPNEEVSMRLPQHNTSPNTQNR